MKLIKTICTIFVFCAAGAGAEAQSFSSVASFGGSNGRRPGAFLQGADGNFYGATFEGGTQAGGVIFKMTPTGTISVLANLGVTGAVTSLMQAKDGTLYGTSEFDGVNFMGTIFKITTAGALTKLHDFAGSDGENPIAGMIQGSDGNLYGTTGQGGAGAGTIFKLTPAGTLTTLHVFSTADGSRPAASLIQGADGNFYGITQYGGPFNSSCVASLFGTPAGCGTIFKMTAAGALTTIYHFTAGADGLYPATPLVQTADGSLYGMTNGAGFGVAPNGTIFKVTTAGALTVIANFTNNNPSGNRATAGLVAAADGKLYGTTSGSLFNIAGGVLTVLYNFCSQPNCSDGEAPFTLILGADGNIYGTTLGGGTSAARNGTVFEWTLKSTVTTPIVSLVANAEGESPVIAPNTWVEIKGLNLAPAADIRIWQGPDFVNSQLPLQLDGVSATVNGKSAYIYYISPTQVNILTPPDAMSGPVTVVLTNNGKAAPPITATAQALSPSFFVFDGTHIIAQHGDYSLVGPATLYPGATTPAQPGEAVILYANGFGPTSTPVVSGALSQGGDLLPAPIVKIGGITAVVKFAGLIAVGEYQFNVEIPAAVADGEQPITAVMNGSTILAGAVIAIQH